MPEYLLWHILFLGGTGFLSAYWLVEGRHRLFVRELCQRLGGKVLQTYGSIFGWKVIVLQIWSRQRQIFVEYRYRQIQPKSNERIFPWQMSGELEVRVPLVQKFWLRLLRQQQDEISGEELLVGIPEIDKNYVIHADQAEIAIDFLKRPAVQDRLMRLPIIPDRLEIYKGFLKAVINQPYRRHIQREEFENTVHTLLDLVDVYEHQPVDTFHVLMSGGDRSCPYCRGLFDSGNETLVKCIQCGTSLHQQCWQENGQCTTWGCASVTAE